MNIIQLLLVGGGLMALMIVGYLALSGKSPAKESQRRLQAVRYRHSESTVDRVESQLKKAIASRKPKMHKVAGSGSRVEALNIRLQRTGKGWTLTQYLYASLGIALVIAVVIFFRSGAVLLSLSGAESTMDRWIDVVVAVLVVAGVVRVLAARNERLVDKLVDEARVDPLTGLLNRRGLEERMQAEIARAAREGTPLGAVVFDLDHFKDVNDTHGHELGDRVLVWLGAQILLAPYLLLVDRRVLRIRPLRLLRPGMPMLLAMAVATLAASMVGDGASHAQEVVQRVLLIAVVAVPMVLLRVRAAAGPGSPIDGKLGVAGSDTRGANANL
jgi:predicted signal transduction protein with EAL and GGDEF domain